ncbi:unnamed protein product [Didymodactylos carnosus]|uniref:Uncharacterized protein n=1 Tax=Didymodactylos carnosus TaxID=1234261 RepID=A0A814A944_9BILA|nr:unnamed protein product [Didymodactylos carnosus]CAF3691899.1 unnamed protein product [Didymodactylos carnosus]
MTMDERAAVEREIKQKYGAECKTTQIQGSRSTPITTTTKKKDNVKMEKIKPSIFQQFLECVNSDSYPSAITSLAEELKDYKALALKYSLNEELGKKPLLFWKLNETVTKEVPRGTIIDPPLFLVYKDDLPNVNQEEWNEATKKYPELLQDSDITYEKHSALAAINIVGDLYMDNSLVTKLEKLASEYGVKVLYGPKYHCELNPIERFLLPR